MIQEGIVRVVERESLSLEEAAQVMDEIMGGEATPSQFGAFVTALRLKGETPDEIAGMARVMREKGAARQRGRIACGHVRHGRRRLRRVQRVHHSGVRRSGRGGRRWPSTVTAPCRARAAARTCWRRSGSRSISARKAWRAAWTRSGSGSCSPSVITRRCGSPRDLGAKSESGRCSTYWGRLPIRRGLRGTCWASRTRPSARTWRACWGGWEARGRWWCTAWTAWTRSRSRTTRRCGS